MELLTLLTAQAQVAVVVVEAGLNGEAGLTQPKTSSLTAVRLALCCLILRGITGG
jgi:hypothetical protein